MNRKMLKAVWGKSGPLPGKFFVLLALLLLWTLGATANAGEKQGRYYDYSYSFGEQIHMKGTNCTPIQAFNSDYPPFIRIAGANITESVAFVCEKKQSTSQVDYELVVQASSIEFDGWQTWHPFNLCPGVISLNEKPGGLRLKKRYISPPVADFWTKLSDNTVTLADSVHSQCLPSYGLPVLQLDTGVGFILYTCINGDWYFDVVKIQQGDK